ncbi:MAG: hypothetical protein ACE15F_05025 [bacterium]
MKRRLPFILFWWMGIITANGPAGAADWKADLDAALKAGQAKNQPVVAFFFHPFYYQNPARKREDFLVWESPLVTRYDPDFIHVKVDVETNADMGTKYKVSTFPAVLFFDPQGREILALRIENEPLKRYLLAERLKAALTQIDEFTLVEQQIQKNTTNPQLVLSYAKGLRDRAQFDKAEDQFQRLFQWPGLDAKMAQDAQSAYTNLVFFRASVDFYEGNYDRCIDEMKRFLEKNPASEAVPQAQCLLGMALYEGGRPKEGESLLQKLSRNSQAGPFQEQAKRYLDEKKGGKKR